MTGKKRKRRIENPSRSARLTDAAKATRTPALPSLAATALSN